MLPDITLDNERYDDIMETAKNMIVSMYPEWTDFNYHDPGVTLLELFAWTKESQQYFINKIGSDNYHRFLKLLGISRRTKKPARTYACVKFDGDILVVGGTKFYAGGMCFEAEKGTFVPSAQLICCVIEDKTRKTISKSELSFGGSLRIRPFPAEPSSDAAFYIGLSRPLPEGESIGLYVGILDEHPIKRNPITEPEGFVSFVTMIAEYYDGYSWCGVEEFSDKTFGFLQSGEISIKTNKRMQESEIDGNKAYFLRFRIMNGEYDIAPVISSMSLNLVMLCQRDTKSEYHDFKPSESYTVHTELAITGNTKIFVKNKDGFFFPVNEFGREINEQSGAVTYSGIDTSEGEAVRIVNMLPDFFLHSAVGFGTGLPFQQYDLESDYIEYETFEIMTELPDSGGAYAEWRKVKDFSASTATDFHYILDTENGRIKFGDCINSMAPEGKILIIGCCHTMGAGGNVTSGKINRIGDGENKDIIVSNDSPSFGGENEESMESCFSRAHMLLQTTETIVTSDDYVSSILKTQGLKIEKCQVIRPVTDSKDGGSDINIRVVVKPYSLNGKGIPSSRYIENIHRQIEKVRMLGTRVTVVSPEYADFSLYADITTEFHYTNAAELIDKTVRDYFQSLKDCFGAVISYSELFGRLDRLECVISVNTLTLDTYGSGVKRTREGDLILSPNVAAFLVETDYMINAASR